MSGLVRDATASSAVVSLGPVPIDLLRELPGLYGSMLSTAPWFAIVDEVVPSGVCILSQPRHLLVFAVAGDTVDILNKGFAIAPGEVRKACNAIFAALPHVRRIRVEVPFAPKDLSLPSRVLAVTDNLVVDVPSTVDQYTASLGRRTRKNLRNYRNTLRREHPDVVTEGHRRTAREMREVAEQYMAWNVARMRARGGVSVFESDPTRKPKLLALLVRGDVESLETTIDGRLAAVEFIFYVGREATVYAGSFDDAFAGLHLGFLSTYWAVCRTVDHGATRCHLLWTSSYYKERLGARHATWTRLSVFQRRPVRLQFMDEAARRDLQRLKDHAHARYHRMRTSLTARGGGAAEGGSD